MFSIRVCFLFRRYSSRLLFFKICLISLIDIVSELSCISSNSIVEWIKLVKTEMSALKGILKSDKVRFKNICEDDWLIWGLFYFWCSRLVWGVVLPQLVMIPTFVWFILMVIATTMMRTTRMVFPSDSVDNIIKLNIDE